MSSRGLYGTLVISCISTLPAFAGMHAFRQSYICHLYIPTDQMIGDAVSQQSSCCKRVYCRDNNHQSDDDILFDNNKCDELILKGFANSTMIIVLLFDKTQPASLRLSISDGRWGSDHSGMCMTGSLLEAGMHIRRWKKWLYSEPY